MTLLVTRPQHDDTTLYISTWAEEIISAARQKGLEVIDLRQVNANKKYLGKKIKERSPQLVFLNGHGRPDRIFGHQDEVLIEVEDNHHLLTGKITYALSCNAGQELGHRISKGFNSTFIGYKDEFRFVYSKKYVTAPQLDPLAKPFMRASNKVMISLLEGHHAREASDFSKDIFREKCHELLSSDSDQASLLVAQCLWWNMSKQVCLGKSDAKLSRKT